LGCDGIETGGIVLDDFLDKFALLVVEVLAEGKELLSRRIAGEKIGCRENRVNLSENITDLGDHFDFSRHESSGTSRVASSRLADQGSDGLTEGLYAVSKRFGSGQQLGEVFGALVGGEIGDQRLMSLLHGIYSRLRIRVGE